MTNGYSLVNSISRKQIATLNFTIRREKFSDIRRWDLLLTKCSETPSNVSDVRGRFIAFGELNNTFMATRPLFTLLEMCVFN